MCPYCGHKSHTGMGFMCDVDWKVGRWVSEDKYETPFDWITGNSIGHWEYKT